MMRHVGVGRHSAGGQRAKMTEGQLSQSLNSLRLMINSKVDAKEETGRWRSTDLRVAFRCGGGEIEN